MDYRVSDWVTFTSGSKGGPGDGRTYTVQVRRRMEFPWGPGFRGVSTLGHETWGLDVEITAVEKTPFPWEEATATPVPVAPGVPVHSLELVVDRPDVELTWTVVPHGDRYAVQLYVKVAEEV